MGLMWRYAEVSGNPRWKGMTWGMLPALGSAMSACTWHFFYNSPDLEFLVPLQVSSWRCVNNMHNQRWGWQVQATLWLMHTRCAGVSHGCGQHHMWNCCISHLGWCAPGGERQQLSGRKTFND
jgi:hypothetical protein